MQALEQLLKDLHTLNQDEKSITLIQPVNVISDIDTFCTRISDDDIGKNIKMCLFNIGLVSSLLFDEEKGITAFVDVCLRQYPNDKTMTLARKACFEFVNNYIKRYSHRIPEYALPIIVRVVRIHNFLRNGVSIFPNENCQTL